MGEGPSQSSGSLTGVWQGLYSYPVSGLPTVPFTATLIEAGRMLSGSVHEQCTLSGETLFFSVNGSRHGSAFDSSKLQVSTALASLSVTISVIGSKGEGSKPRAR